MKDKALPILPCMCASFRRAARALTQIYDEAMRPMRLRATQFTVLQVLELAGEVPQGKLGQMLAMDSTTLTRTLENMRHRGWVAKHTGTDKRERFLALTRSGRQQLRRATPAWEAVQARLRRELGDESWKEILKLTNEVTTAVTH